MNYTYVVYCNCGFEKVIHQNTDQAILQCQRCRNIESKDKKYGYHLECLACGTHTSIGNDIAFDEKNLPKCPSCYLQGVVGFERSQNTQFILETNQGEMDACSNCHRTDWNDISKTELSCPMCFTELQQKMSNYWE